VPIPRPVPLSADPGVLFAPDAVLAIVNWGDLFERAAEYDVEVDDIRSTLDRLRGEDADA